MRFYDLIDKKKNGGELTTDEIAFMVEGYVSDEIPDYQMSAMLMAVFFQGMNDRELSDLTIRMAQSGDMIDLTPIQGIKVDKHSTGGVGDKTTLVIAPIVAACGGKVAKMSGRGLGFTGGTIDKLEAIPGFRTTLSQKEFFDTVNKIGVSVIGQSADIAPADKKMYALRDVTATVNSIPLIAASIMSKKLAAGSDCILLDVTTGSGAFIKDFNDSVLLAKKMTAIGNRLGRKTEALITNMDTPLGFAIGNNLEVIEAVETLKGNGPEDLKEVCYALAAGMLTLCGNDREESMKLVEEAVSSGRALNKLVELVEMQGGDSSYIKDTGKFTKAAYQGSFTAVKEGYISSMNTEQWGIASGLLGAGRETKDSVIDFGAGIILKKKTGDFVKIGDEIVELYSSQTGNIENAKALLEKAYVISDVKPEKEKLVLERIDEKSCDHR